MVSLQTPPTESDSSPPTSNHLFPSNFENSGSPLVVVDAMAEAAIGPHAGVVDVTANDDHLVKFAEGALIVPSRDILDNVEESHVAKHVLATFLQANSTQSPYSGRFRKLCGNKRKSPGPKFKVSVGGQLSLSLLVRAHLQHYGMCIHQPTLHAKRVLTMHNLSHHPSFSLVCSLLLHPAG
jgi:hypothetical protein